MYQESTICETSENILAQNKDMPDFKTTDEIRKENAKQLAEKLGSNTRFAERIQREPTQVSRIIGKKSTKKIGDDLARHIERCLNMPEGWLDNDHNLLIAAEEAHKASALDNRVCEEATPYGSRLSFTAAPEKTPIYDLKSMENPAPILIGELTCPVESGPNTYGVIVPDDTMESPHFRHSYPKGSVIFIDPDQASQAKDEDFVIAKWDDGRLTFKRLIENQEGRWLRSINPMYPPVPPSHNGQFQVTGLVIGYWVASPKN